MNKILTIYWKEMKEVLRDRKTVIFMIVLPTVIIPVLFNFMFKFIEKKEKEAATERIKIAILHEESIPGLTRAFRENAGFEFVTGIREAEELKPAIRNGDIKVGLVFPTDGAELLETRQKVEISAYYNNASLTSRVIPRTRNVLETFSSQVRKLRFEELGVTGSLEREALIEPAALVSYGIAEEREIWGERIGGFLPYLFIAFCFLGAYFPAIDIGAGEKERGTLETLLLTPVPRAFVVLGKFMVVFTSGIIAALLCVVSMGVWIGLKGEGQAHVLGKILSAISPFDFVFMGLILLPMAAIFASALLSISIYAKNFKEAQSYAAPLQFFCILPAVLALLPGVDLNWTWAMVPITNISLAIKELVKGTIDYNMLAIIFGSTTVFAGAALFFCVQWFKREEVLFRN